MKYKNMTDEDYIVMRSLEDKYTKIPTLWELTQAFNECRDMVAARLYFLEKKGYKNYLTRFYKKFLSMTKKENNKKEIDVQKAKQVPILELYDFIIKHESKKRIQAMCPFHDEKNGSFFIFKDQNRFHCFSCQSSGDSISFIQKLNNLEFIDAVMTLNRET